MVQQQGAYSARRRNFLIFSVTFLKTYLYNIRDYTTSSLHVLSTDFQQKYYYVNHLLIKILTQKIFLLKNEKIKSNASKRSLILKN